MATIVSNFGWVVSGTWFDIDNEFAVDDQGWMLGLGQTKSTKGTQEWVLRFGDSRMLSQAVLTIFPVCPDVSACDVVIWQVFVALPATPGTVARDYILISMSRVRPLANQMSLKGTAWTQSGISMPGTPGTTFGHALRFGTSTVYDGFGDRVGQNPGMTPQEFKAQWSKVPGDERQFDQEHFTDLCAMFGQPKPTRPFRQKPSHLIQLTIAYKLLPRQHCDLAQGRVGPDFLRLATGYFQLICQS
jgi:hypothetical protein